MKAALIIVCFAFAARAEQQDRPNWYLSLSVGAGHQVGFGSGPTFNPLQQFDDSFSTDADLLAFRAEALRIVSPAVAVGAFFEYTKLPGQAAECSEHAFNCSGDAIHLGVRLRFESFARSPERLVRPWFAIGAAYEVLSVDSVGESGAGSSVSFGGLEYLRLQAGLDFRLGEVVRLGPFVEAALGRFFDTTSGEIALSSSDYLSIQGGVSLALAL